MTELEALARKVGSRRYARDLIEEANGGPRVLAKPWWDMPGEDLREIILALNRMLSSPISTKNSTATKPIFTPDCWPFK